MNKSVKLTLGLLAILAVVGGTIPVLADNKAADGPNLLVNPGFESPYGKQCCHTEPNFPPNVPIDEVQVANGWRGWWREPSYPNYPPTCDNCTAWHRPEWREAAPFSNRIHGGANAQKYFTFFSVHEAGMYQQVSGITPGQRLRFSVYMHAWSTNGGSATSTTKDNDMGMKVGIDPAGGADPFSGRIVWSTPVSTYDNWGLYSVEAVAQGSTVTVYTYSKPRWGLEHNDIYVDDASLVAVTGTSSATNTPPPTSTSAGATAAPTSTTAPTSAPPTAPPTAAPLTYTVQRGDTLRSIARKFNTTVSALLAINSITNPNVIYPGQVLRIPGTSAPAPTAPPSASGPTPTSAASGPLTTYTIQRGDTLFSIGRKFGVTASAIIAVNPGINANRIFPGQVINLPFNNAGQNKTYVVQRGDNLRKIAAKFITTIAVLQQLNGLSDPNKIFVGQTLIVP